MRKRTIAATLLSFAAISGVASAAQPTRPAIDGNKPTIVLVHGAFAESASWNGVIGNLEADGYTVVAAANPLRSVKGDAAYVGGIVGTIGGPVVLVGHSYGGEVISVAAVGHQNVKALVFVAGLAPDVGESATGLGQMFPTGTLGQALAAPVPLADGGNDLYIRQDIFWAQFAADVPMAEAKQMAATQRPIEQAAFAEPAGQAAWHTLPSWFIWGSLDKNIPSDLHAFMAKRAGARQAMEIKGASHVVMISHPRVVADLIEQAALAK
jgi:pimeloyl-ACP methyl ester carboxylesterase